MLYTAQEIEDKLRRETDLKYHPWIVLDIVTEHQQQGIADFGRLANVCTVTSWCEKITVTVTDTYMSAEQYPNNGRLLLGESFMCKCNRRRCRAHCTGDDMSWKEWEQIQANFHE